MSAAAPAADLMSPLALFMHADIVVKLVMIGLLVASVWTWGIIITHVTRLRSINRATDSYERDFWAAKDLDAFHEARGKEEIPTARIVTAGLGEWRRSIGLASSDRSGARERLTTVMSAEVEGELDRLSDRLNILATVASAAPFIGLFGTVWGIMRSFTAIAGANNTSLAVVAPGIAEALFATAIGLFAAIPALIAYNRLTHGLDRFEARLNRFADRFHATLSREFEREG
ncbi:protein TolQ [Sphingomonas rosea]|uniref:Protein TolQ n=1 Tax=Sphingomonas rosea TaxID=335605 RepID=A0ABP7TPD4_9SPHN